MDVTPFLDPRIAPRAIFDSLPERKDRPRFLVPAPDGDWQTVTWGEHAEAIRRTALFLVAAELQPGERAAIYAPNSVEWMTAAMAIQAAGGVMVPIYPANTAAQAAYVANHSDARVLFVDSAPLLARVVEAWPQYADVRKIVLLSDLEARVPAEVEKKLVRWPAAQAMGAARDREDPAAFQRRMDAVSLDQPGLMLYTSGTSGNPKGVPLTHRNVAANGRDWLLCNGPLIDERSVDLLWLPMSHVFGLGEACLGNTLGFTTYLCDPLTVCQRLPVVRPNVFMSVPSVWEKLSSAAGKPQALGAVTGGRLKFCLSGGAGLKCDVKEFFHAAGVLIIEGYGLTEASPTLTMNRHDAFRFDSVGKPFPSVELELAEDGEILAKGPNVFGGYHKDPAATKEIFTADGWLKTGDVGRWTEDGFLQIVDRKKDILVTAGGKNVAPANIELRFQDDPYITHLVVFGDGQRYLTAGVWVNPATTQGERDVRALVQERIERVNGQLASYETIKKFAILEPALSIASGHLTPTLKIRRKRIYETFREPLEALYR